MPTMCYCVYTFICCMNLCRSTTLTMCFYLLTEIVLHTEWNQRKQWKEILEMCRIIFRWFPESKIINKFQFNFSSIFVTDFTSCFTISSFIFWRKLFIICCFILKSRNNFVILLLDKFWFHSLVLMAPARLQFIIVLQKVSASRRDKLPQYLF